MQDAPEMLKTAGAHTGRAASSWACTLALLPCVTRREEEGGTPRGLVGAGFPLQKLANGSIIFNSTCQCFPAETPGKRSGCFWADSP